MKIHHTTFELEPEMLVGVDFAIHVLEDYASMTFEEFKNFSCSSVTYAEYKESISTHKQTLKSLKRLSSHMARTFGVMDYWG